MGIPQAIIGIALFAVGAIYPFIGVHNIYVDMFAGHAASQDFLWVVISLLMLALGYFYLKESMWLVLGRRSFKGKPKNLPSKSV